MILFYGLVYGKISQINCFANCKKIRQRFYYCFGVKTYDIKNLLLQGISFELWSGLLTNHMTHFHSSFQRR